MDRDYVNELSLACAKASKEKPNRKFTFSSGEFKTSVFHESGMPVLTYPFPMSDDQRELIGSALMLAYNIGMKEGKDSVRLAIRKELGMKR